MTRTTLPALALAALALAGCEEKSEKAPAAPEPVHATAPQAKKDFGGGYKGTRWGMSPDEVEKVLGAPVEKAPAPGEADLEKRVFHVKDEAGGETKKENDAYFLGGRLMRATLVPHFSDDNAKGYDGTLRALTDKYGPGQTRNDLKDRATGARIDLVGWTDGQTLIQLRVDKLSPEDAKAQNKPDPRLYSTTQVIYTSVPMATEREKQLAIGELRDAGQPIPPELQKAPGAADAGR